MVFEKNCKRNGDIVPIFGGEVNNISLTKYSSEPSEIFANLSLIP